MAKTQFETFLEEEIDRVKGVAYPVKAGILERIFVKNAACTKLHPNPHDEFCMPEVGPNYSIISRYESEYRRFKSDMSVAPKEIYEPIDVEKIRPDGYMILNGHHRWAGARRVGMEKLRIRIVNLTQKEDILKMLKKSRKNRRVTLDLDEVVFRPADDPCLEKPLSFPFRLIYRERLRLGIPALFHMLRQRGYDIWIFTARNYSVDYLRYYFLHYFVSVTGIVTGTGRKAPAGSNTRKELEELVNAKYTSTIHIDGESVIRVNAGSQDFEEFRLSGDPGTWSREVMTIFEKMSEQ